MVCCLGIAQGVLAAGFFGGLLMKGQFGQFGRVRGAATMREKFLLGGFGMMFLGMLGTGVLLLYSRTTEARQSPRGTEAPIDENFALGQKKLIAPREMVATNTRLSRVVLKEIYWPRDKVPEGAITSIDEVQEMYAKVNLAADLPITRSQLTANTPSTGITTVLPPGHRAVTIEVNATQGLEGWATPGTHVDVLVTYKMPKTAIDTTRVAVFDAVVISYNGKMERISNPGDEGPLGRAVRNVALATVTLAVPFDDTLKIQTASSMGRLSLIARSPEETTRPLNDTFSATEWDERRETSKVVNDNTPAGFAEYTTPDGRRRSIELGRDGRMRENDPVIE